MPNRRSQQTDVRSMSLERRLYVTILLAAIGLSAVSIVGNVLSGFPAQLSVKWAVLIVAAGTAYLTDIRKTPGWNSVGPFYLFLILVFLPFAFIESGGSANNAFGYTFLLLVTITYLFRGTPRTLLVLLITTVYVALIVVEHRFPEVVHVHAQQSQFVDRLVQVPLQFLRRFGSSCASPGPMIRLWRP